MAEWLEKINVKTKFCFKWNFAYQYTSLENEIKSKKRYSTIPLIQGLKLSMESIAFCQVKK